MTSRFCLAGLVLIGACASSGSDTVSKPEAASLPISEPVAVSLPAQTLEPGTCGLFLWTRDEPRHFIMFYVAGGATAKVILDEQEQDLRVASQAGDVFGQFLTRMTLQSSDGQAVSLTLSPGEEIDGGRRVPLARMISQDSEGWEIITPLTGLTACQPE